MFRVKSSKKHAKLCQNRNILLDDCVIVAAFSFSQFVWRLQHLYWILVGLACLTS